MPQLLQCVGSFERIQEYYNFADGAADHDKSSTPSNRAGLSISLQPLAWTVPARRENDQRHVIALQNNSFTWENQRLLF
jgi:hypothetical protein